MSYRVGLVGEVYGRATITSTGYLTKHKQRKVKCLCLCGKAFEALLLNLRRGNTQSCGCILRDTPARLTHGATSLGQRTPEYRSWEAMRRRCLNSEDPKYPRYGGRGIKVCTRWDDFALFLADMGLKPTPQHTIDRKENDKGYYPDNCRWATKREQALNTSRNERFTFAGKTLTIIEWSEETGIPHRVIQNRLRNLDWSIEEAVTTPPVIGRNQHT